MPRLLATSAIERPELRTSSTASRRNSSGYFDGRPIGRSFLWGLPPELGARQSGSTPTGASYIDPGSPWQNPFVESFNSKLRDELLSVELFETLLEAQVLAEDYRIEYNTWRPHSSIGQLTPAAFAKSWTPIEAEVS
jgi:hypothetical protein